MRTIAPRLFADALIWFGASKCGSRRRYEFTDEFKIRQMSFAEVRMRSTKSQPGFESMSGPFASKKVFLPFLLIDRFVCMPLPFTPVTGFGRNEAVMS